MKSCCAVLVAALFLGACVATKPSVTYSSFGEARLAEDAAVVQRYEADYERRHPSSTSMTGNQFQIPVASGSSDVKVLVDTFPEGVELVNGSIRTTDGAPHEILGKLSLRASSHGTLPREKLLRPPWPAHAHHRLPQNVPMLKWNCVVASFTDSSGSRLKPTSKASGPTGVT